MRSKGTEFVKAFGFTQGAKFASPGEPRPNPGTPAFPPGGPLSCFASEGYCSLRLYLLFWQDVLSLNLDWVYLCLLWSLLDFMQHSYVFMVDRQREAGRRPHLSPALFISSPEGFLR